MKKEIVYLSKSTIKSLWQEYRIFKDHLEFATLAGDIMIPFENVEKALVSESEIKGLLKGDLHLKDFRPAIKLDWANFTEHIVLDKKEGIVKRILFTPDDPKAFINALEKAFNDFNLAQD